jgi:uncharacterized heparinase superfamily protein
LAAAGGASLKRMLPGGNRIMVLSAAARAYEAFRPFRLENGALASFLGGEPLLELYSVKLWL